MLALPPQPFAKPKKDGPFVGGVKCSEQTIIFILTV